MRIRRSFRFGNEDLILETGELARQATGAVLADMGGTVVLATVVVQKSPRPGRDFFPLTADYSEKSYAADRIPANFSAGKEDCRVAYDAVNAPAVLLAHAPELSALAEIWPQIKFHSMREHSGLVFQSGLLAA